MRVSGSEHWNRPVGWLILLEIFNVVTIQSCVVLSIPGELKTNCVVIAVFLWMWLYVDYQWSRAVGLLYAHVDIGRQRKVHQTVFFFFMFRPLCVRGPWHSIKRGPQSLARVPRQPQHGARIWQRRGVRTQRCRTTVMVPQTLWRSLMSNKSQSYGEGDAFCAPQKRENRGQKTVTRRRPRLSRTARWGPDLPEKSAEERKRETPNVWPATQKSKPYAKIKIIKSMRGHWERQKATKENKQAWRDRKQLWLTRMVRLKMIGLPCWVAGSDKDILKELDKDWEDIERTGPPVGPSLSMLIKKTIQRSLSDCKVKDRFEEHPQPENCEGLQTPMVNLQVWKSLPIELRRADRCWQPLYCVGRFYGSRAEWVKNAHTQKAVAKAAIALADSTHALLRAKRAADAETRAWSHHGYVADLRHL